MAVYSDINTVRRDFWGLTEDELPARTLERAATMAYNYINRYLSGIYNIPFSLSLTPPIIEDISDLLTEAYAISFSGTPPEKIGVFKIAVDMLEDIARGKAEIIDESRVS